MIFSITQHQIELVGTGKVLVRCCQGAPHLHLFRCVIDVDYLGEHIGQKHEDNKNPDPHNVRGNISTNLCRFFKVFLLM